MHEAGHHVIARHRGMREVDSWIERVGDPTRYETSWVGIAGGAIRLAGRDAATR